MTRREETDDEGTKRTRQVPPERLRRRAGRDDAVPVQMLVRMPPVPLARRERSANPMVDAQMAQAARVESDAGMVLTRTDAHRRVTSRETMKPLQRALPRRTTRQDASCAPFWASWGGMGAAPGGHGRVLPSDYASMGGRKEPPYAAEFPRTSAPIFSVKKAIGGTCRFR